MHSAGSWYKVMTKNGAAIQCRVKGKLRNQGIRTTNPVAVGDHVHFEVGGDGTGSIKAIAPRRNCIIRKAVKLSHHSHIIAANIDRAYLITTLIDPPTSTGFIDRFLVGAQAHDIPVSIVFNKVDRYGEFERNQFAMLKSVYQEIGYECMALSALKEHDVQAFAERLDGEVNLLSGHSGVGKSTLINGIAPDLELKTGDTSAHYHLGKHTTTFAEMFPLPSGGYIIDTPGIKGFGIVDIPKEHVGQHFPEMHALSADCRFANCVHINEPGCEVKANLKPETAVSPEGSSKDTSTAIAHSRYQSYLSIYHSDDADPYRRG